jgi:hypothetical protein
LGNSLVGEATYPREKSILTLAVADSRIIQWRLCGSHVWLHCDLDVLLAGCGGGRGARFCNAFDCHRYVLHRFEKYHCTTSLMNYNSLPMGECDRRASLWWHLLLVCRILAVGCMDPRTSSTRFVHGSTSARYLRNPQPAIRCPRLAHLLQLYCMQLRRVPFGIIRRPLA